MNWLPYSSLRVGTNLSLHSNCLFFSSELFALRGLYDLEGCFQQVPAGIQPQDFSKVVDNYRVNLELKACFHNIGRLLIDTLKSISLAGNGPFC